MVFRLMDFKELLRAAECRCVIVEKKGEDDVKIFDGWAEHIPMDLWRRPVKGFRKAFSEKTLNILLGGSDDDS